MGLLVHRQLTTAGSSGGPTKYIMAEFKFSCPQCGQHIQCDPGYSGAQINCPSCQQSIVVPQAPRSAAARRVRSPRAGGPCDQAKHRGAGDGTTICRRARRTTAGQGQIEGAENCFGHRRVGGGAGRPRRGRLVRLLEIQGTQNGGQTPIPRRKWPRRPRLPPFRR